MMRLNAEVTKFKTLEHIAGVHYVSMTIARGLYAAGAPIDLTLISGAAAAHDLGKFGCKPNEKVPYMHYYYTAVWAGKRGLAHIGQIAANHSTWDLEPQNLTVESLVLIYSDFRVKSSRGKDGVEITHISSMEDAFSVILNKLDNVDAKKLQRYRFVHAKLADFEDYMRAHGVDVDLNGKPAPPEELPLPGLRNPEQTIRTLVHMTIEHNMDVMHQMTAEQSFGNILEAARSEKNWKNVRAYLNVLQEYFAYTSDTQKEQALSFLYELFMNRDGEIRVQAAELMGQIIAQFNAGYRSNAGKCFTAETERMQGKQIVRVADLACGVPRESRRYVLRRNTAAVVAHADQFDPAAADLHLNGCRSRIQRIFDEFLDDRNRPFDHLAGCDLVYRLIIQYMDLCHL